MVDYSFIRLKPTFQEAKNIGDSPVTTHPYYDYIQLLPNEAYLQITNVDGGLSFQGDYKVLIVDCNENELADVTNNVFIKEFTDSNGSNQLNIEYVNLTVDFYKKTVYFKFIHTISDVIYYSNPIIITDYESEQTTFFEYWNYNDFEGIGYKNAGTKQAISIKTYFDIPVNESETQDYYQISTQNTISSRLLIKRSERYQIDYINAFTYDRLNLLLGHDMIYIDGVRVTNKTVIESSDREGQSNFMTTDFTVSKNYNDILEYAYQVFEGIQLINVIPQGAYTLIGLPTELNATFNYDIAINTGSLTVYDSSNTIVQTFTEADMSLSGTNAFTIDITGVITLLNNYYIKLDSGLISSLGIEFEGVNDMTTWVFRVQIEEYNNLEYNNLEYLTI